MPAIIPAAFLAALLALCPPAHGAAPVVLAQAMFLAEIEDLPLMPGLAEEPDSAVVFDTDSGRLVTVQAFGHVGEDALRQFYGETLLNLGWVPLADGDGLEFSRGGERLTLDPTTHTGGLLRVRFSLTPLFP